MSFERFLMGNMSKTMSEAYVTLVRWADLFQKPCKTLGYMEIIVFEIAPMGRGENHIYPMAYKAVFQLSVHQ